MMPKTTQEIRFAELKQTCAGNFTAAAIVVLAETIAKVGNQTHDHRVELTMGDRGVLDIILNPPHGSAFPIRTEE